MEVRSQAPGEQLPGMLPHALVLIAARELLERRVRDLLAYLRVSQPMAP